MKMKQVLSLFVFGSILFASVKCGPTTTLRELSSLIVNVGTSSTSSVALTAVATYSDHTTEDVTAVAVWATNDSAVALMSTTPGSVSAVGAGSAKISALYSGYLASASATVTSSKTISVVSDGASTSAAGATTGSTASTSGGTTTSGTTTSGSTTSGTTTSGTTTSGSTTSGTTSGGTTTGGTTGSSCSNGGTLHNGACWWLTNTSESCVAKCSSMGKTFNTITATYPQADINNCGAVLTAMGNATPQGGNVAGNRCCFISSGTSYNVGSSCDGTVGNASWNVVCSCQ